MKKEPEGLASGQVYPYIYSENARKQAEFYAEALNGRIAEIRTFADAPKENMSP